MTFLAVLCAMGLVDILIIAYQKHIGEPVWFISIANLSDCLIQRLPAFKGKVFHVEKRLEYSSASEKAAQRRQHLKAMIDDFYQLIEEALTKSPLKPLRNAIKNALKLKKRVYQMFRHGELPLHNNHNEQLIRPTTLVRKNSLFAKSTAGAKANAIWYSIVQTAKLNHLDVFKYLETLLNAFTKRETPEIEAYLPWAREIQESCKA